MLINIQKIWENGWKKYIFYIFYFPLIVRWSSIISFPMTFINRQSSFHSYHWSSIIFSYGSLIVFYSFLKLIDRLLSFPDIHSSFFLSWPSLIVYNLLLRFVDRFSLLPDIQWSSLILCWHFLIVCYPFLIFIVRFLSFLYIHLSSIILSWYVLIVFNPFLTDLTFSVRLLSFPDIYC